MSLVTRHARPVIQACPDIRKLADGIARTSPRPHHSPLLEYLRTAWPEVSFQHQLSRSGWYRPGGVLSRSGQKLGEDLENWLQESLDQAGDFDRLLLDLEVMQPLVTRYNGYTHFLSARFAEAPEAFWQLEVEELQEVMDRRLLNARVAPPEELADLLEPLQPAALDAQPLSSPAYRLGRLMNLQETMAEAVNQPLLNRFLKDWRDGVENGVDFRQFWFFQRHEALTRHKVTQMRLQPQNIRARQLKTLPWDLGRDAPGIASQLRAYDKTAGYHGAWYFGLVAGNLVPRELPARLQADWQSGYRYLPERQNKLVRDWLHQPYTL